MFNFKKISSEGIILFCFLFLLFIVILSFNAISVNQQHFSQLANSFLHGQTYFLSDVPYTANTSDIVFFNNNFYWPLGPFPAILLMPFVALANLLGFFFFQGYLNIILVLLVFYLIFKLARKISYNSLDSAYLALAFVAASMFLGVAAISSSWYFAHTIVVFFLFLSFLEYLGKRRWGLIGLFFAFVLMTRVTAFIGILFFVIDILFLQTEKNWPVKIKRLIKLIIAPVLAFILLMLYNYFRFNDFFDQGYLAQVLSQPFMEDKRNWGLFNLKYLPRGLYYSLINMPQPVFSSATHLLSFPFLRLDPWGMSIFATSPYLLSLFFLKIKDKQVWTLLAVSALILFLIASSFFSGFVQFGFRYALDFMTLLFIAFMIIYRRQKQGLSKSLKIAIILSACLNIYLLFNFWTL